MTAGQHLGTAAEVHELMQLLESILNYSELLADGVVHPSKASELEQLGRASEKAVEIVRELAGRHR